MIITVPRLVEIYKKTLLPSSSLLFEENWFLQEDNDPKHRSRLAKNWRELNNVNRIDFPSYSPDHNPIENLWRVMKYKVAKFHPQTKAQLIYSIHLVWKTFSKKIAQNLINSMPNRINTVIQRKGDSIDY